MLLVESAPLPDIGASPSNTSAPIAPVESKLILPTVDPPASLNSIKKVWLAGRFSGKNLNRTHNVLPVSEKVGVDTLLPLEVVYESIFND